MADVRIFDERRQLSRNYSTMKPGKTFRRTLDYAGEAINVIDGETTRNHTVGRKNIESKGKTDFRPRQSTSALIIERRGLSVSRERIIIYR